MLKNIISKLNNFQSEENEINEKYKVSKKKLLIKGKPVAERIVHNGYDKDRDLVSAWVIKQLGEDKEKTYKLKIMMTCNHFDERDALRNDRLTQDDYHFLLSKMSSFVLNDSSRIDREVTYLFFSVKYDQGIIVNYLRKNNFQLYRYRRGDLLKIDGDLVPALTEFFDKEKVRVRLSGLDQEGPHFLLTTFLPKGKKKTKEKTDELVLMESEFFSPSFLSFLQGKLNINESQGLNSISSGGNGGVNFLFDGKRLLDIPNVEVINLDEVME